MTFDFEAAEIVIGWLGESVVIELDASCVSDAFEDSREPNPLNEFANWVAESVQADPELAPKRIVELVRGKSRPAAIWRRILAVAASSPEAFAVVLQPLTCAPEALKCLDLSHLIGDFLKSAFALFCADDRRRTEEAILGLPDFVADTAEDTEAGRAGGERARDRLLGCLPEQALTTDAARARLSDLRARNAVPENHPPVGPVESSFEDWTETDRLEEQGVSTADPVNQRFNEVREPLIKFSADHANKAVETAAAVEIEPPLRELWIALQTAEEDGVALQLVDLAWDDASRAALTIVRSDGLANNSTVFHLARDILLAASHHGLPESRSDTSQFDRVQGWGVPSPRVEAADGLVRIAYLEHPVSDAVSRALESLATDGAPEVRFYVAKGLPLLRRCAPELMWHIADQLIRDEVSTAVLSSVAGALPALAGPDDGDRIQEALEIIYDRGVSERSGAKELRQKCTEVSAGLYIWRGTAESGRFLRDVVVAALQTDPEPAGAIARVLRQSLSHGEVPGTVEETEIRTRAVEIATSTLQASIAALSHHVEELRGMQQPPDDDPVVARTRAIVSLIDGVASDIFFGSGAYEEMQQVASGVQKEVRERLYWESGAVLDLLGEVPVPAVTHHILEALEMWIPLDPRGVFLRVHRTVLAGRGGAYELDSQGARLVVTIIERYLAEHRTLLQEDAACRAAIVEVLDIFVSVGWPAALRLTYGLQDIYR